MTIRFGYIGLGDMGSAMAGNLIGTGAAVTVFDLDGSAVEKAVEKGAKAAGSAKEVAAASDIVSICVPAAEHIEAVLMGPGGMAEGAHEGLTILIHSTVHPDTMRTSRDAATAFGAELFDACVGGGTIAADTGDLIVFAGGLADMPSAARDLIDTYGSHIIDAGPVGAGAAIKIAFNVMTYSQFSGAKAAIDIVETAGASAEELIGAWRYAGQLGTLTERALPMLTMPGEHVVGDFRAYLENQLNIATKDLELAAAVLSAPSPHIEGVKSNMAKTYGLGD